MLRDGVIFSAGISYNITEGIYLDTSIVNSSRRLAPLSALETLKGVIKKLKLSIDIQKAFTDEVMGTGGSAAALSTIHFSSVTGVTEVTASFSYKQGSNTGIATHGLPCNLLSQRKTGMGVETTYRNEWECLTSNGRCSQEGTYLLRLGPR